MIMNMKRSAIFGKSIIFTFLIFFFIGSIHAKSISINVTPLPGNVDVNYTINLSANVPGSSSSYTGNFYVVSYNSSSWNAGTPLITSQSGNVFTSNYISQTKSTLYFYFKVNHHNHKKISAVSRTFEVKVVSPAVIHYIGLSNYYAFSGNNEILTGKISNGVPPFNLIAFSGSIEGNLPISDCNINITNYIKCQIAQLPYVSSQQNDTYKIAFADADAKNTVAMANVIINPPPSPQIYNLLPSPPYGYSGQKEILSANIVGGAPPFSVNSLTGSIDGSINISDCSISGNYTECTFNLPTVTKQTSDTYTLTITDNHSRTASSTVTVTVNPQIQIANVVIPKNVVDVGQKIILSANVIGGSGGYRNESWHYAGGSQTNSSSSTLLDTTGYEPFNAVYIPESATPSTIYFYFSAQDSSTGVNAITNALPVTVNPDPTGAELEVSNATVDQGQGELITSLINGGTPPYTYNLSIQNSSSSILKNISTNSLLTENSVFFRVPLSSNSLGILQVNGIVTDANGYNAILPANSITVYPDPSISIDAINSIIDVGQNATFNAVISGGAGPFTVNLISGGNTLKKTLIPKNGAEFVLSYKTTSNTINSFYANAIDRGTTTPFVFNSIKILISINSTPYISNITPNVSILDYGQKIKYSSKIIGGTGPFTVNLVTNGNTIETITGVTAGNTFTFNSIQPPLGEDAYYIVATDTGTSTPFIFNSISNTISVNSDTSLSLNTENGSIAFDNANTLQIVAKISGGTGPFTYKWNSSSPSVNFNSICTSTTNSVNTCTVSLPNATSTTHYTIEASISDAFNSSVSNTLTITDNPSLNSPVISASKPIIDLGQNTTIEASVHGGTGNYTYTYYKGDSCNGSVLSNNAIYAAIPQSLNSSLYCVLVDDGISSSANTISIRVNPIPSLSIIPSANAISPGQSISLNNLTTQGTPPYSRIIYTTDAPKGSYTITANSILFNAIGNFSITGTQSDSANFVFSNTINVEINGTISNQTANYTVQLPSNTLKRIIYKRANTTFSFISSNSINARLLVKNVTNGYNSTPALSGYTFAKTALLNITLLNASNSISTINVTMGFNCSLGASAAPYLFTNGTWTQISPFSRNLTNCTVSFSIPIDPVMGIFSQSKIPPPSNGGGGGYSTVGLPPTSTTTIQTTTTTVSSTSTTTPTTVPLTTTIPSSTTTILPTTTLPTTTTIPTPAKQAAAQPIVNLYDIEIMAGIVIAAVAAGLIYLKVGKRKN